MDSPTLEQQLHKKLALLAPCVTLLPRKGRKGRLSRRCHLKVFRPPSHSLNPREMLAPVNGGGRPLSLWGFGMAYIHVCVTLALATLAWLPRGLKRRVPVLTDPAFTNCTAEQKTAIACWQLTAKDDDPLLVLSIVPGAAAGQGATKVWTTNHLLALLASPVAGALGFTYLAVSLSGLGPFHL